MMKKIHLIIPVICVLFPAGLSLAVNDLTKDEYVEETNVENGIVLAPGMELRKIGGINMVVPKGLKVYKQGPLYKMEEEGGFAARRLIDMDDRFNKMEEKQKRLEEEIVQLRKTIESLPQQ